MRRARLSWLAAALAAALAAGCGEAPQPQAGPLDRVYLPAGMAVHHPAGGDARLVVASTNADLRFADESGGAVLSIDPVGAGTTFGVNIPSFAGDLALARREDPDPTNPDPGACGAAADIPGTLAITATRGSNTVNAVLLEPSGAIACHRCGVALTGGTFADPFAVAAACGGGRVRAFVGYLRSLDAQAWISEWDLESGKIRSRSIGSGPARGFAYDPVHDRLWVVGLATGSPTPLRWVDLRGCRIDLPRDAGGCTVGEAFLSLDGAVELRSIALGRMVGPGRQRAFLTGRFYDAAAAVLAGGRTNDFGGVVVAVDLVENALGGVDVERVWHDEIGRGAQDVRVLRLPGWPASRGDVVAALAMDEGALYLYDDETQAKARFGRSSTTGSPSLGHEPFGLAADPEPAGSVARLYVGSFRESFITPMEVPLDQIDATVVGTTFTGAKP